MRFRSPCKLIHDQAQIGVNDTSPSAVASSVRHYRNLQRVRLTHVSHRVACHATAAAAGREGCAMGYNWRLTNTTNGSAKAGLCIRYRE
jgi:hypothetical protein